MPIAVEHLRELERLVADSVRAVRDEAERAGELPRFHAELKSAVDSLRGLAEARDCDYDLPFMGEAYALWYHMRRVSQLYNVFDKYSTAFRPLEWDRPWRMLDVGAGTGAGGMALARWILDRKEQDFPGALRRASVTCLEPALPMLVSGQRIAQLAVDHELPAVLTDWRHGGVGNDAVLGDDTFDVILFSTTFDYFDEADKATEQDRVVDFVRARLAPRGSILFLVPNAGYKDGVSGPKIRFVTELLRKLEPEGFTQYGVRPEPGAHLGLQEEILRVRCDFFDEAFTINPLIALDRARTDELPDKEQPRYTTDTFSYGCWMRQA
jgi:SAM-dependent methyltransferase